ncbi:hypothetical protein [Halobacteriaceae bacterium SHR40]|uniref:hypothetical protein n=1 Tax=Halovenus amylolytica TaxID=2500550 RepID=UPI000FE3D20A
MAPPSESEQFEAIQEAQQLSDLSETFGIGSIHEIYFSAKEIWQSVLRERQRNRTDASGLAGTTVDIDGQTFHVHGITHVGTEPEAEYLREYVTEYLRSNGSVYCEQGIRSMYFEDFPEVCEMDDYLWAMDRCEGVETASHVDRRSSSEPVFEETAPVTGEFRDATFSLIDSGSTMYGEKFEQTLGDIAASFLTDHADIGVGKSYEAFQLRAEASRNPERLVDLQEYYERTFLPQPLEREWLRYHDPELELMSHARNERMAEYAMYHNQNAENVHLVVGAAHQPGVVYYLEQYRDGRELPAEFELY